MEKTGKEELLTLQKRSGKGTVCSLHFFRVIRPVSSTHNFVSPFEKSGFPPSWPLPSNEQVLKQDEKERGRGGPFFPTLFCGKSPPFFFLCVAVAVIHHRSAPSPSPSFATVA